MEDQYFVIDVSCDGARLSVYTKKELLDTIHAEDGSLCGSDQELMSRAPKGSWDLMAESGVMIIKGKIVTPKPKEVVTEYEVD